MDWLTTACCTTYYRFTTLHFNFYDCESLIFPFCRDCKLEENLLISKGTSVGAGTVITNSVIGRNCVIGKEKGFVTLCVVFGIKLFLFLNFTDTILQYTELPAICFAIDHVFNFLAKKFLSVSNKATKQCWGQIYSSPALPFRKYYW